MTHWPRPRPGDPLRIPADAWNALLDLLDRHEGEPLTHRLAAPPTLIKNTTGQDRNRFEPLPIAGPLISPTDNPAAFLAGHLAAETQPYLFAPVAVALEPIAAGAIGRAAVTGLTPVRVRRLSATQPAADAALFSPTYADALLAAQAGTIRLLWEESPPDPTAPHWALADLSAPPRPIAVQLLEPLSRDSNAVATARLRMMTDTGYTDDPNAPTLPVADLYKLGLYAPADTPATIAVHYQITYAYAYRPVIGAILDVRC